MYVEAISVIPSILISKYGADLNDDSAKYVTPFSVFKHSAPFIPQALVYVVNGCPFTVKLAQLNTFNVPALIAAIAVDTASAVPSAADVPKSVIATALSV